MQKYKGFLHFFEKNFQKCFEWYVIFISYHRACGKMTFVSFSRSFFLTCLK